MIFNDIIGESKTNYWNRLLQLLDKIFGFNSGKNSTIKRVNQGFDRETGEHVIYLEYRVRISGQSPIAKNSEKVNLIKSDNKP